MSTIDSTILPTVNVAISTECIRMKELNKILISDTVLNGCTVIRPRAPLGVLFGD